MNKVILVLLALFVSIQPVLAETVQGKYVADMHSDLRCYIETNKDVYLIKCQDFVKIQKGSEVLLGEPSGWTGRHPISIIRR